MSGPKGLRWVLGPGVLALAACGEGQPPTQPESPEATAPVPALVAASNTWTARAAYPFVFGAVGHSAGVRPDASGQSIVDALGGTDDMGGSGVSIYSYHVATDTWTQKSYEPRIYTFNHNGAGRIGSREYFSGGEVFGPDGRFITNEFWAYEYGTNRLIPMPSMPKNTSRGITGVIDGKLYVLPGLCSGYLWPNPTYCDHEPFRRLFRFNPATNRWASKTLAPHYHADGAGGVINGKFYVAGGAVSGAPTTALDVYDPATDIWKTLKPLPIGGRARGAVLQDRLFVIVSKPVGAGIELHAYSYNPATDTWTAKAAPKWEHSAVVRVILGGKQYLFASGGIHWNPDATPNPSELFTP